MRKIISIVFLLVSLTALLLSGCGSSPTDANTQPAEPAMEDAGPDESEPGVEDASANDQAAIVLVETRCTDCHSLSTVTNASYDEDGWARTVARMITKGASLNDEERILLIQYLTENYGP
ncbi:MAG: hypothetical protein JXA97_06295 [Anaerolineales bacterium]|nr:hypothetical protein [Anaerolineales bacterium]